MSQKVRELKGQFGNIRRTLDKYGKFLPATLDEPPEEPQIPDIDKTDDDSNFDPRNLSYNIETPIDERPYVYPGPMLGRVERNFFTHFLDGSIRTYYLGEQVEGNRAYPVMATEVASAVVSRDQGGKASIAKFMRRVALLVPPHPPMSDDTWNELVSFKESIEQSAFAAKLEIVPLERQEHREGVDLRTSLAGKARAVMHDTEHSCAGDTSRTEGQWLVIDGAIRKSKFLELEETIGLAKSFSRKPVFSIEKKRPVDVVSMLSGLQEGHRTIVFKQKILEEEAEDPVKRSVAFWYLRLRSGRGLQGPLQGIVKVDLRLQDDTLDADSFALVNTASRALMAEKYVSPYPTPRWHAHIYPVFVAENYIKSCMYSPMVFRGYLT